MRKSLLSVLMLLVLVIGTNAQPISEQEALQKAQQFLQGKNIVSSQGHLRRAAKAHPYKHLYLFNAEDNGGFVIVSGDSRARDIIRVIRINRAKNYYLCRQKEKENKLWVRRKVENV